GASRVDLANTDYTNLALWNPVTTGAAQTSAPGTPVTGDRDIVSTYTALGGGAAPSYNNLQSPAPGATVHLDADYDTPDYTVGAGAAGAGRVNLQPGDVVQDGAETYRYVGPGESLSLPDARIKSDPADFKAMGGISGDPYPFVGPAAPG